MASSGTVPPILPLEQNDWRLQASIVVGRLSVVDERGDGGLRRPQQCRMAVGLGVPFELVVRHRRQTPCLGDPLLRSPLKRLCRVNGPESVR